MGAIAAAVNRKGEDVVPTVLSMLTQLKHRGTDACGVATPTLTRTADSIEQLAGEDMTSDVAVGHNLSSILPEDNPQPVLGQNFALAFEGRIFPPSAVSDTIVIIRMLGSKPQDNASSIIERFEGSYAFAIASEDRIIAGRDTMGTTPLYYGENEKTFAIASERKALWAIGIENAKSFPPGNLTLFNARNFLFHPIKTIMQPPQQAVDIEKAAKHLQTLLLESTEERLSGIKTAAVAFSGGLDSGLTAMLAKMCGIEAQLITVGLENQHELQHAKTAANILELPLHIQTYTQDDVEQALPRILWLIEEPDVMKAGVAIPLFWTAEIATKLGFHVLLAGQGADELFGGYQRYLKDYVAGEKALRDSIYRDVMTCYERNFQRDNQVCSFHKVEVRLPFIDKEVVNFSLAMPTHLKIESPRDSLRKRVLRVAAQNLGMSQFIFNRRKKAVQYATGVHEALRRLAGKESLTLREYIKRVFSEAYLRRNI